MSKKPRTTSKKEFSYTPQNSIPKLKKYPKEWDLRTHFYTSTKDKNLEKDIKATERAFSIFARKYAKKNFTVSKQSLLKALKDYEKLLELGENKPLYYLWLRQALDSQDPKTQKLMNLVEQRLTKASTELIFFTLEIGKISGDRQKTILTDSSFSKYWFFLKNVFDAAKYQLTEAEEKILSLKSLTSRNMWISGTEKIVGSKTITVDGETLPLNGALMEMLDAPKKRKHALWKECKKVIENIGPTAENELNAIITDKKITDELRGYKKPYSATVMSYDSSEKSLETLVNVITTKGYALSRKYYAEKTKLLNKKLDYIDRNEKLGTLPSVPYETAVSICRDAFYEFDERYGKIFDEMLTNGLIDAFPRKGKSGGAFCIGSTGVPTLVLLNHSDDFNSVATLAHEMGHAVHAYRSKTQSALYDGHSIITAETASTFFESVVGNKLLETLQGKQRMLLLDTLIASRVDTMMMCIARYNAELEIHETIRREGSMTWQDMSAVLAKHFRSYCGKTIKVVDSDGLSVLHKTHYRRNFYQFTYSFGELMSGIMFHRYQKNKDYGKKVDQFLCAGEKDTIENIYREIGINPSNPKVFEEGLSLLRNQISEFTRLAKKYA